MTEGEKPEVVILGMQSSGKTVFLSVLGRAFQYAIDDQLAAPLGFCLNPQDETTRKWVDENFEIMKSGKWPRATPLSVQATLKWRVKTGARDLFGLSSLDVPGELVHQALDVDGQIVMPETFGSSSEESALLGGMGADEAEESMPEDRAAQWKDKVVRFRETVNSARVICLFLNVANVYLEGEQKPKDNELDKCENSEREPIRKKIDQTNNFRDAVDCFWPLLNDRSLRRRALVVLTQSDGRKSEIEDSGGPLGFLRTLSTSFAQIVSDNAIPVIAVSAVNEYDDASGKCGSNAPAIARNGLDTSSGLLGFLLSVAGACSEETMGKLKNAYFSCLETWALCGGANLTRTIPLRLEQNRRCKKAREQLETSCRNYLGSVENLSQGGRSPRKDSLERYLNATETELDRIFGAMLNPNRETCDCLWDRYFKNAVNSRMRTGAFPAPDDIIKTVREQYGNSKNDRYVDDLELFGFDPYTPGAPDYVKWVERNLNEYFRLRSDEYAKTEKAVCEFETSVLAQEPCHDGNAIIQNRLINVRYAIKAFDRNWRADGSDASNELQEFESRVADAEKKWMSRCDGYANKVRARRRCNIVTFVLSMATVVSAGFMGVREMRLHEMRNDMSAVRAAIAACDYDSAEKAMGEIVDVPFLFIYARDLMDASLPINLQEARAREEERRRLTTFAKSVVARLQSATNDIDYLSHYAETELAQIITAKNAADVSFQRLPPPLTFEQIANGDIDKKKWNYAVGMYLDAEQSVTNLIEGLDVAARIRLEKELANALIGISNRVDSVVDSGSAVEVAKMLFEIQSVSDKGEKHGISDLSGVKEIKDRLVGASERLREKTRKECSDSLKKARNSVPDNGILEKRVRDVVLCEGYLNEARKFSCNFQAEEDKKKVLKDIEQIRTQMPRIIQCRGYVQSADGTRQFVDILPVESMDWPCVGGPDTETGRKSIFFEVQADANGNVNALIHVLSGDSVQKRVLAVSLGNLQNGLNLKDLEIRRR